MEAGSINDILGKPLHPYTIAIKRLFDERKANNKGHLPEIRGFVPSVRDMPKGCPFNPRCEFATEICRKELPPVTEDANHHTVRCFNYKSFL